MKIQLLIFAVSAYGLLLAVQYIVRRLQRGSITKAAAATVTKGKSPYEVLGIPTDATRQQIEDAYEQLIQRYSPDRATNMAPVLQKAAASRTEEITTAYQTLTATDTKES